MHQLWCMSTIFHSFLLRLVIVPDHYWPISRYFQSRLSHHHLELLHSIPLGQKALNYIHHRTVVAAFLWYISEAESVCLVWWWPSRGPLKANISFFLLQSGLKKVQIRESTQFFRILLDFIGICWPPLASVGLHYQPWASDDIKQPLLASVVLHIQIFSKLVIGFAKIIHAIIRKHNILYYHSIFSPLWCWQYDEIDYFLVMSSHPGPPIMTEEGGSTNIVVKHFMFKSQNLHFQHTIK